MKTMIKSSLFAFTAIALTGVSYADAVRPQSANQPAAGHSVALLVSGVGTGATCGSCARELKTVAHDNGHGQAIVQFVR